MPMLSGLQMRILTDEVWHSNYFELLPTVLFLELFKNFLELLIEQCELHNHGQNVVIYI